MFYLQIIGCGSKYFFFFLFTNTGLYKVQSPLLVGVNFTVYPILSLPTAICAAQLSMPYLDGRYFLSLGSVFSHSSVPNICFYGRVGSWSQDLAGWRISHHCMACLVRIAYVDPGVANAVVIIHVFTTFEIGVKARPHALSLVHLKSYITSEQCFPVS